MLNVSSKLPLAKKTGKSYDPSNWGPSRGIVTVIIASVLSQVLAIPVVLAVFAVFPVSHDGAINWINSASGQFVLIFLIESLAIGLAWLMLQRWRPVMAKVIGLARPLRYKDTAYAVGGTLIYFALLIVLSNLAAIIVGVDTGQRQNNPFTGAFGFGALLMAFIGLVVLPPVVEEILFRGVLFGGLRAKLSFVWSTVIVSSIFALAHLTGGEGGSVIWIATIDTFILSVVLCYLRERTGSLWASIGLHMIKNGIAYVFLFVFI